MASPVRLSLDRLMNRIGALGRIGAFTDPVTGDTGVCRLALTGADRMARDQLVAWMRALGLTVSIDAIGNIVGLRAGRGPAGETAPVMLGSHIDSVATGGRYDGALGVLAGLEVVEALNESNVTTRRPIAVAAFTNEEGSRFAPDMMGSLVFVGGLPLGDALATVGIDGTTVGDDLARIGYAGSADTAPLMPSAFLELHVEQGPVLDHEGVTLGAVTGVQGISWTEFTIDGVANHAGTTPMALRHDAGHAAAAIACEVRRLVTALGPPQVGTVGTIRLHPGLVNVVAGQATLTVDLRNTDNDRLREAETLLHSFVDDLAAQEGVRIASRRLARFDPVAFDETLVSRVEALARDHGHAVRRLSSGAGHDAQMLAPVCPTAMIFVPSRDGISHNPAEHTDPAPIGAGAQVLLDLTLELANTTPETTP